MITAFFCMIAGFSPIFAEETGSAANDCSITISGVKPGQTYTAYQIFLDRQIHKKHISICLI